MSLKNFWLNFAAGGPDGIDAEDCETCGTPMWPVEEADEDGAYIVWTCEKCDFPQNNQPTTHEENGTSNSQ
jgi:Zn-finger protein